ncbi:sterol desaturase family protein [Dactylosporangium sp. NPDC051541]|uniref:sterol desaturase family protein n=1 Tax=Dactylosporangium sp. NPDC051541 TaxID=3363977 RepID=UPI003788013B
MDLTRSVPVIMWSMPVIVVLMVAEAVVVSRWAARTPGVTVDVALPVRRLRGYSLWDTVANLALAALSTIPGALVNAISVAFALFAWDHRLFSLGTGWTTWVLAIVVVDFNEYWNHRAGHRIRLLWANHVQHHSSTYLNVSTALRTPIGSFSNVLFFPWLAVFGFQPWIIFTAFSINAVYQIWIHTEVIGKLPAWFEFVFTTPSHHRVHHGSNGQYIDKNYGSVFIIWDRMFGTFQPEDEPVNYGLIHDIGTNNVWTIFTHEYVGIFRDMRRARGLWSKLRVPIMPPGWQPEAARMSREAV